MRRIGVWILILLTWLAPVSQAQETTTVEQELASLQELDLQTAQTLALKGNPDIIAAQTRIEQARARVRQAVAAYLPSVDLVGSGSRQQLSDTTYEYNQAIANMLGSSTEQSYETYSTNLQATLVLFDGFYRGFQKKQAEFNQQSNIAALDDTRRLLMNSVAEAFLNAQLHQTNIDIAQADKDFYVRQLEDAQNRYNVGAGAWGDVLNIKVQLNSAKTSLMQSQRDFEAASYGLAALLGIPDARFPQRLRLQPLDRQAITEEQDEASDQLIQEALQARPDIRRLEMTIKQAEAASGMAKAAMYPNLELAGSLNGSRDDDPGFTGDDFGNSIGVNMRWNLYSGGADTAKRMEADQAKREAVYTLTSLRNSVAAEIRQDLALLAAAREQVRLQRETAKLVKENRDLAQNEYEAGESSLVRLNEAQRDLITTHGRLAQALVAYKRAKQQLYAATGRNLELVDSTASPEKP